MIERDHPRISISRQCEMLGISRSAFYYQAFPESSENLEYMRLMDEQYIDTPFYGVDRMWSYLCSLNYQINIKRVRRLLRLMGLEAVYPKPNLSKPAPGHKIYPYLLKGVKIEQPNQVWGVDITYIRMQNSWMYLFAILDWHSRFIVGWSLDQTLAADFVVRTMDQALIMYTPQIINSDQGSQFTGSDYIDLLKSHPVQISMDGKGRYQDNIFTERLWRTIKQEEVYLHDYQSPREVRMRLAEYIQLYNYERIHQSLDYQTPAEIFFAGNQNSLFEGVSLKKQPEFVQISLTS